MSTDQSPPGWYPDPAGSTAFRYWDGTTWTDQVAGGGGAWGDPVRPAREGLAGCPRCQAPVDAHTCPRCGLDLGDAGVGPLRRIDAELGDLRRRFAEVVAQQNRLLFERQRLISLLPPVAPPTGGPRGVPGWGEWKPERVRDVVLWLGALLTGLAGLIFVGVAWSRLGQAGRAGLLVLATGVTAATAASLRRRLPATAEALGALALGLVLVDWFAARRAGVAHGLSAGVWWAGGLALDAALAGAVSRWSRSARVAAVTAGIVSGVLVVADAAAAPWAWAVGLAAVAAAGSASACLLGRVPTWRQAALVLGGAAAAVDAVAVVSLVRAGPIHATGDAYGPAAALAAAAGAPAAARALLARLARDLADVLVGLTSALLLGAVVVVLAGSFSGPRLVAAAAVVAALAVVASLLVPSPLRNGLAVVGGVGVGAAALGFAGAAGTAILGPWDWARDPWSASAGAASLTHLGPRRAGLSGAGPAAVTFAAGGAAATAAGIRVRGRGLPRAGWALGGAVFAVWAEAALVPVRLSLPIGGVVAAQLGLGAGALALAVHLGRGSRSPARPAVLAAGLAATATGWALASRGATLAALATIAAGAVPAAALARRPWLRSAAAAVGAGAAIADIGAATAGWGRGPAALAVVLAAGALLIVATSARRDAPDGVALESVAAVSLASAPLVASSPPVWVALVLTAAVPALAAAGIPRSRRAYLWVSGGAALLAAWAWLAAGHVTLPEAYTLPAAALAVTAGVIARRGRPSIGSWPAYGPGLTVALGPSLLIVLSRGGLARPLLLCTAGLAAVVGGAVRRLRAPLVLGSAVLVILALNTAAPVAARLPRWSTIGASGIVLLWLGATTERRLGQLRRLHASYDELA